MPTLGNLVRGLGFSESNVGLTMCALGTRVRAVEWSELWLDARAVVQEPNRAVEGRGVSGWDGSVAPLADRVARLGERCARLELGDARLWMGDGRMGLCVRRFDVGSGQPVSSPFGLSAGSPMRTVQTRAGTAAPAFWRCSRVRIGRETCRVPHARPCRRGFLVPLLGPSCPAPPINRPTSSCRSSETSMHRSRTRVPSIKSPVTSGPIRPFSTGTNRGDGAYGCSGGAMRH